MPIYNTITFEKQKIITIIDNDETIWFNAGQTAKSLNYIQVKKAISNNVDKEDKIQLKNMNISFNVPQQPDSVYINESGLYSLLIASKTKKAKKFVKWLVSDVLPKLRKKNIDTTDEEINKLLNKITELENKNKMLLNDLKLEKFPDGAMVYVIEDFDTDGVKYYKIGKTDNMNKRISVYNTHSIHNKKVVHYVELLCPLQLETCIRSMLYKYRYKNKKDFFNCDINKIIKAFDKCMESIKCVEENISGGGNNNHTDINNIKKTYKVMYYENILNEVNKLINLSECF